LAQGHGAFARGHERADQGPVRFFGQWIDFDQAGRDGLGIGVTPCPGIGTQQPFEAVGRHHPEFGAAALEPFLRQGIADAHAFEEFTAILGDRALQLADGTIGLAPEQQRHVRPQGIGDASDHFAIDGEDFTGLVIERHANDGEGLAKTLVSLCLTALAPQQGGDLLAAAALLGAQGQPGQQQARPLELEVDRAAIAQPRLKRPEESEMKAGQTHRQLTLLL
jgi:hypothetical protein